MSYTWGNNNVDGTITNSTIAASGSSASGAIDNNGKACTECGIVLTYNTSATRGGQIEILRTYDGTNYQVHADGPLAFNLPFTANTTEHFTFTVPATISKFKVNLINLDTGQSITAATLNYRQATN